MDVASQHSRFRSWPITEVGRLEPTLASMGLKVAAAAIDGTGGTGGCCLSDALVSVGSAGRGGTGSFISKDGLIITNHHVALDAVRQASTVDNDYLANGFVAKSRQDELAGPDYEVWITRSCVDVSDRVLTAIQAESDPLARANRLRDCTLEIAKGKEAALLGDPSTASKGRYRCEVREMWPDRTYTLFTFERLRDVRIVYVPPMSLGNFGRDVDNFEWPRHSADFTLLRAYVAPDGEPAEPSAANVPYKPSKFLRVCRDGASPGDFVFLLGFPGHTMRYAPSCRLAYSDEVAVPELIADFSRKLELIARHGSDRAAALKTEAAKKSLANELKRSTGKRVMMRKLGLMEERLAEERELCSAAPAAAPILAQLSDVYGQLRDLEPRSCALEKLRGVYFGSALFHVGQALHEASVEVSKPDGDREATYRERNRSFLTKRLLKRLQDVHLPLETDLVADAVAASKGEQLPGFAEVESLFSDVGDVVAASKLLALQAADIEAVLGGAKPPPCDDAFVRTAAAVYAEYCRVRDVQKALLSERDQHLAALLEIQKANSKEAFYPDANSTLRLSAGHVEGYEAADAVQHQPSTTLAGLIDKHEESKLLGVGEEDFACPERLVDFCRREPSVLKTPVNICYSTDTVGGNSGSPVLNANGEFVAINFDRQRLGLMNEFKWSAKYSRSIGVDVRYILWLVGSYDAAAHIVEEMTQ